MLLRELADRINAHLKRLQEDPRNGFDHAGCYYMGGARLRVRYVGEGQAETISRPKAEAYLRWLDDGHIGRHTDHVRQNKVASTQRLDGSR